MTTLKLTQDEKPLYYLIYDIILNEFKGGKPEQLHQHTGNASRKIQRKLRSELKKQMSAVSKDALEALFS